MGKTATRGVKGQKSRAGGGAHRGFIGGQTPLWKLTPKRGFNNTKFATDLSVVNIKDVQLYLDMGRLVAPADGSPITMRDLMRSGLVSRVRDGLKLLGAGELKSPVHLEVTRASQTAIEAVERAGGSVTTVHYNRLNLRALLKPEAFPHGAPRHARPPPRLMPYYLDFTNRGYLSPEIQLRGQLRKLGIGR